MAAWFCCSWRGSSMTVLQNCTTCSPEEELGPFRRLLTICSNYSWNTWGQSDQLHFYGETCCHIYEELVFYAWTCSHTVSLWTSDRLSKQTVSSRHLPTTWSTWADSLLRLFVDSFPDKDNVPKVVLIGGSFRSRAGVMPGVMSVDTPVVSTKPNICVQPARNLNLTHNCCFLCQSSLMEQ